MICKMICSYQVSLFIVSIGLAAWLARALSSDAVQAARYERLGEGGRRTKNGRSGDGCLEVWGLPYTLLFSMIILFFECIDMSMHLYRYRAAFSGPWWCFGQGRWEEIWTDFSSEQLWPSLPGRRHFSIHAESLAHDPVTVTWSMARKYGDHRWKLVESTWWTLKVHCYILKIRKHIQYPHDVIQTDSRNITWGRFLAQHCEFIAFSRLLGTLFCGHFGLIVTGPFSLQILEVLIFPWQVKNPSLLLQLQNQKVGRVWVSGSTKPWCLGLILWPNLKA